jgi:hypothetical protein
LIRTSWQRSPQALRKNNSKNIVPFFLLVRYMGDATHDNEQGGFRLIEIIAPKYSGTKRV